MTSGIWSLNPRLKHCLGDITNQSSNPENEVELVDIDDNRINAPVVNHVPIVNNASDVDLSDDDAGLHETLRIFESIEEYNKRERSSRKRKREEDDFENTVKPLLTDTSQ